MDSRGRFFKKFKKRLDAQSINKVFTDAGDKAPYNEAFDIIEGLSAQEIKDKFSIPDLPTHISDVNVPAGTNIRVGVAAKVEGWGKGGGTQVEVLDRVQDDWITNTSKID